MKFVFEMENEELIWLVTSRNVPGLLATGRTPQEALAAAGERMTDLAVACALAQMIGHDVKAPFVSTT